MCTKDFFFHENKINGTSLRVIKKAKKEKEKKKRYSYGQG